MTSPWRHPLFARASARFAWRALILAVSLLAPWSAAFAQRSVLNVSPARLDFTAPLGGPNPASQPLQVNARQPTRFFAGGSAPWIQVNPRINTTPAAPAIAVDVRGLAPGLYNGTVTLSPTASPTSGGAVVVPVVVPISLTVGGCPGLPVLASVSPASGPTNAAVLLSGSNLTGTSAVSFGGVAASFSEQSSTQVATAVPAGLPPGPLEIQLRSACGSATVDFSVTAEGGALRVFPGSLVFAGFAGGANPASQTLNVSSNVSSAVGLSWFSAASDSPFLSVVPPFNPIPGTASAAVDTTGLGPGTYTGLLTFSALGVPAVPVPVTLVVNPAPLALTTRPELLVLNAPQGSEVPVTQALAIGSTGGASSFSATTDAPWLTVAPASGRTPTSVAVSAVAAGLPVGIHSAGVDVSAFGAGSARTSVVLAVGAANPTLSVSPAGLGFTTTRGNFPGTQALSIRSILPEGEAWTASATVPWLELGPQSGGTPGTLFVNLNDFGVRLPVGSYSGALLVSAVDGSTVVALPVSLEIRAASTPPPVKR